MFAPAVSGCVCKFGLPDCDGKVQGSCCKDCDAMFGSRLTKPAKHNGDSAVMTQLFTGSLSMTRYGTPAKLLASLRISSLLAPCKIRMFNNRECP
jgi:hypothetical protein